MAIRRLSMVDASFINLETRETPMHVAGMSIFSLPPKAPADYLKNLVAEFKSPSTLAPPFNLKLAGGPLSRLAPMWVTDNDVDLDYHVRHLALPQPGGERELGVLVSRLHSHLLDRSRPMWECHVIEGLDHNRFALYFKIHHALMDGVGGTRTFMSTLSEDPAVRDLPPMWAEREAPEGKSEAPREPRERPALTGSVRELAKGFQTLFQGRDGERRITVPFEAPMSVLNGRIRASRRFATQQFELARIKALAKRSEATLNDIVLALCSAALRRYLKENSQLPGQSLIAGCPVNLRPAGDATGGNAVGYMFANLATDMSDPRKRLQEIVRSTRAAKEHLQGIPRHLLPTFTTLLMAPMIAQLLVGLVGRMRPAINVTISNVPGPDRFMYFNGAKLEASYPVSIPTHGQAVNITCTSYAGTLNFGFTGCRDTLPHMQRLAVYTGEALEELDDAVKQRARAARSEHA